MLTPPKIQGLRHVALNVQNLEACVQFYTAVVGMKLEWQPDPDNVYLTSGQDNLALHRTAEARATAGQRLSHFGFILETPRAVDEWYQFMSKHWSSGLLAPPKIHRDGAKSFYCHDPDGNTIQFSYHPSLAESS